jgi:small multidrug resistance pump
MGYLFLLLTILSEAIAIVLMKLSGGFQHKGKAALALLAFGATYVFLTLALRQLPAGLSNAIWAGASTIL